MIANSSAPRLRHRQWLEDMRRGQELHDQRMKLFDEKMLEIEEKLNALIQVLDGMQKRNGES